jgi:multiple sugar transport system ATP-binding protein
MSSTGPRRELRAKPTLRESSDVRFADVSKRFGSVEALRQLNLAVERGSFLVMLGPSGCGKTTALRILAGLESPTTGRIIIGSRDATRMPPQQRDIAMVFQGYALYPHMSVRDNIAYPLRLRKWRKKDRARRAAEIAEMLELGELLDRKPRELSGGQRQRVAVARAIIREPAAFLMDEPLSNLDAKLRIQMRGELKRLQKDLGVTTLYVTHDQSEATTMADIVAVMHRGTVVQRGTPREIYDDPADRFVAGFVGNPPMNLCDVHFDRAGGRLLLSEQSVSLDDVTRRELAAAGTTDALTLGVRPENVILASDADEGINCEVYLVQYLDNETLVTFRAQNLDLVGRFAAEVTATIGDRVRIKLRQDRLHFFDADDGARVLSTRSFYERSGNRSAFLQVAHQDST